jgi:hypothetical protein
MRRKERKYASAKKWAENQGNEYTATFLNLPPGLKMFKPKPGTSLIDIVPFEVGKGNPNAEEGDMWWERTFYSHKGIGANGDTYICPARTYNEHCPICEHRAKLDAKGREQDAEVIKALKAKERQLFYVRDAKNPDKGIMLWDMSTFLFGDQLSARLRNADEDDDWDNFFHDEDGLTLRIGFSEETYNGKGFCKTESIDFKNRKFPLEPDEIDDLKALDDLLIIRNYDDLADIFLETKSQRRGKSASEEKKDDDDNDDADNDGKGRRARRSDKDSDDDAPRTSRSSRADKDDDGDDEPRRGKSEKNDKPKGKDWSNFDEKKDKGGKGKGDDDEIPMDDDPRAKRGKGDDDDKPTTGKGSRSSRKRDKDEAPDAPRRTREPTGEPDPEPDDAPERGKATRFPRGENPRTEEDAEPNDDAQRSTSGRTPSKADEEWDD